MPQLPRHIHDSTLPPDCIRFMQTVERLPIGTSGEAKVLSYSRTLADWVVAGQTFHVYDALYLFEGWEGDVGIAQWRLDARRWEIIAPTQRKVGIELTSTLNKGGTASAKRRYRDNADGLFKTSNYTLTVRDAQSIFSGVSGHKGYAEFFMDQFAGGRWEVTQLQC